MERIRKEGYSEGLKRLARIVQNQQSSESVIKQVGDSAHVTLYRHDDVCVGIMRALLSFLLLW